MEEENSAKTEQQPKRGAVAAKIPATKLEFEENIEVAKATLIQDEEIQVLTEEDASEDDGDEPTPGSEEKEVKILQTRVAVDDVNVIEDEDAADEMKDHEEEKEPMDMNDLSEGGAPTEKTLESTLEEGEIR